MHIFLILLLSISTFAFEIKVASYNVENLFDLKKSGHEYSQYSPSYEGWNIASYQTKLENISDVISAMNPDILVLQEIENETVLVSLMNRSNAKGCNFKKAVFGEQKNSQSVGVAILSSFPIFNSIQHPVRLSSKEKTRSILESTIRTPSGPLRIIAVHWPSKANPESSRMEAATVVRSIIDTFPESTEYLICGDFNTNFDETASFLSDSQDDTNGKTGLQSLLLTTKSKTGKQFSLQTISSVKINGKGFHYDPWHEVKPSEQYSYRYRGQFNTLDHILLPKTLLDTVNLRYKDKSFSHFTMNGFLISNSTPIRWEVLRTNNAIIHRNRGWSDHLPIFLTLSTNSLLQTCKETESSGSFETCNDGWIVVSPKFMAYRSKDQSVDGNWSLKVFGADKANGTLLKLTAIIPPNDGFAKIHIAGSGEYGIRIKKNDDKKWNYLKGTSLSSSAANSYSILPQKKWIQRLIPLAPFNVGDMVNLEIRYRGNVPQQLYLDKCSLNGWFRPQGKLVQ